jgi:hypothetical protein
VEIDAEIAKMAEDIEYQKEALQLESEFALAQWEALQLGELQAGKSLCYNQKNNRESEHD